MKVNFLKLFICTVIIFCVLCGTFTAAAESDVTETTEVVTTETPVTEPAETEPKGTEPAETEPQTQKPTVPFTFEVEEPDTKAPTQTETQKDKDNGKDKTTKPAQTTESERHEEPATQGQFTPVEPQQTQEQTTENKLPEGAFYVYLERNNGTKRLTCIMFGPGMVTAPEEPVRKGYVFDGWYSDKEFKEPWTFSSSIATKEMTIYAKWVADASTVVYNITVKQTEGGRIEVNPSAASEGEPVMVTVIPDEGKRLIIGSLLVNGEPKDVLSFSMPKGDVVISATFEDIPQKEIEEEEPSKLPVILIVLGLVIIVIVVVLILLKRRPVYGGDIEFDETADDSDDSWIDDTIQISDGFVEGKKVNENTEPIFDEDDEDFDTSEE